VVALPQLVQSGLLSTGMWTPRRCAGPHLASSGHRRSVLAVAFGDGTLTESDEGNPSRRRPHPRVVAGLSGFRVGDALLGALLDRPAIRRGDVPMHNIEQFNAMLIDLIGPLEAVGVCTTASATVPLQKGVAVADGRGSGALAGADEPMRPRRGLRRGHRRRDSCRRCCRAHQWKLGTVDT
jgi:hypothetical protein